MSPKVGRTNFLNNFIESAAKKDGFGLSKLKSTENIYQNHLMSVSQASLRDEDFPSGIRNSNPLA